MIRRRRRPNHDAQMFEIVQGYVADREAFEMRHGTRPTYRLLGQLVGISESAAYNRLMSLKARGLITWAPGELTTLRIVSTDLSRLREQPVDTGQCCTARGCSRPRAGDQWCYEHERQFKQYRGAPICST